MKKLIVIFLVLITTVIAYKVLYAQFNTSSVDANVTTEITIATGGDSIKYVPMILSHSENFLVIRNNAGAGIDTFLVDIVLAKRLNGSYTALDTIRQIATTSMKDNATKTFITVAAGSTELNKLNIPFGYEAKITRTDKFESGNTDVVYFITSEPGQ